MSTLMWAEMSIRLRIVFTKQLKHGWMFPG